MVVLAGCYWWFHPAINLHSTQVWNWIVLIALVGIAALWIMGIRHDGRKKLFHRLALIPAALIVVYAVGFVAGMPFIPGNAARYATRARDRPTATLPSEIKEVDYSEIPVIDRDSAVLLGNRAMGSIPEYVSQFEI